MKNNFGSNGYTYTIKEDPAKPRVNYGIGKKDMSCNQISYSNLLRRNSSNLDMSESLYSPLSTQSSTSLFEDELSSGQGILL